MRKQRPEVIKKVIPLVGDISLNDLGLTDEQRECLINETQIVFNLAAAVRLEAKLKDAVESNTVIRSILQICFSFFSSS